MRAGSSIRDDTASARDLAAQRRDRLAAGRDRKADIADLRLSASDEDHRRAADDRVSASSLGLGIPAGKIASIFERFEQVDASDSREKGGTGLGP